VAARITRAIALELGVIAGSVPPEAGADELVDDVCEHLSALLCDVLCGHLDGDLVRLADELLAGRDDEDPFDAVEPETGEEPVVFPVAAPYSVSKEAGSVMPARHDM
jgi:hypothetical protein